LKGRREIRRTAERELAEQGESVTIPSWDELREEDLEQAPAIVISVEDASGGQIRRFAAPTTAGMHRVAWDLRWPSLAPIDDEGGDETGREGGPMVAPGSYTMRVLQRVDGELTQIGEARTFDAEPLGIASLPAPDRRELAAFHRRVAELQRAVMATVKVVERTGAQLDALRTAVDATPWLEGADAELHDLGLRLAAVKVDLLGDETVRNRTEPTAPSVDERIDRVMEALWSSTAAATSTHRMNADIASESLTGILAELRPVVEAVQSLQVRIDAAGGPWTPGGGLPVWPPQPTSDSTDP